jgi:hypothetical protein
MVHDIAPLPIVPIVVVGFTLRLTAFEWAVSSFEDTALSKTPKPWHPKLRFYPDIVA